jgi:hypothetical protein
MSGVETEWKTTFGVVNLSGRDAPRLPAGAPVIKALFFNLPPLLFSLCLLSRLCFSLGPSRKNCLPCYFASSFGAKPRGTDLSTFRASEFA